jgi:hypothetical protein
MGFFKKTFLPILVTGIWINISETIRWELIVKSYWIEYYRNLDLVFPIELANNLIWMMWGFLVALVIFILSKKFNLLLTTFISWISIFVMLWIVLWNINMLPTEILKYVIPLSFIEVLVGAWICTKVSPNS